MENLENLARNAEKLSKGLNEIPLTEKGNDFYQTLKDFEANPWKYIVNTQPNINSLQSKFQESDAKVEKFIQDAKEKKYLVYYLTFPDKQGFFWDHSKKLQKESNSAYVIILENENSTRGKFMMLPNSEDCIIKQALRQAHIFIYPVCDINSDQQVENIGDTGVVQIESGELYRDNSVWRINKGMEADLYTPKIAFA
jgi:hypothetical protein